MVPVLGHVLGRHVLKHVLRHMPDKHVLLKMT